MSQTQKIGRSTLNQTMAELDKAYKVAAVIRRAEEKHAALMTYANSEVGHLFPNIRAKAMREAGDTMAAHARMIKYFNVIINEIHISQ